MILLSIQDSSPCRPDVGFTFGVIKIILIKYYHRQKADEIQNLNIYVLDELGIRNFERSNPC